MQKILFAKVEAWVVLLLAILGIVALIGFGSVVIDQENGKDRLGAVGRGAHALAQIPQTVKNILDRDKEMMAFTPSRFKDQKPGWTVDPAWEGKLPGYVLLSHYDPSRMRHTVELVSLSDMKTVHQWWPDADQLLADVRRTSPLIEPTLWNNRTWRAIHPVLMPNGDLIVKDHQSALFRLDACGQRIWKNDDMMYHHSTQPDGEGGVWVPGYVEPHSIDKVADKFAEDAIVHVSGDGKVLSSASLTQALIDAGFEHRLFGAADFDLDPSHLNDIEPVLADGAYWKKGDLFLSMRRLSMIALYRPSENRIVWYKDGPWMSQHDVDIVGPTQIAIFDNQAYDRGLGARVKGYNRIAIYDFATDQVTYPYAAAMEKAQVQTLFEGLADVLPGGVAMVEEENAGRLLFVTTTGETAATYLNLSADGTAWRMGWSRYLGPDQAAPAVAALAATTCAAN